MNWIAIPTITAYNELVACVDSILNSNLENISLVIAINGGNSDILDYCQKLTHEKLREFKYFFNSDNLGCSASWNLMAQYAFMNGAKSVLIINDDLIFSDPDGIVNMFKVSAENPEALIIGNVNAFSSFVLTTKVYKQVGQFDENFWPAYFEDNDYHHRCDLEGIKTIKVEAGIMTVGSVSIKTNERLAALNNLTFKYNQQYFEDKWGGPPGCTKFSKAFDGDRNKIWSVKQQYELGKLI